MNLLYLNCVTRVLCHSLKMDSFDPEDHRHFLEFFKAHVDPNDQLPVKVPGYNLTEAEITGEVVNWSQSYLLQMKCPQVLLAPIINEVLLETKKSYQKIPKQCGFDGYSYNPLKLSIIVIGHINTICDRLMDNAELNKILPDNSNSTNVSVPHHSVKAIKNTRRKMEDRHICIRDFNGMYGVKDAEPTSFYGVFDGHGGQDAAIYTSAHLCYNIAKSSKYPHNIEAAMREAFLKTDDAFIDKSDKHAMYSGTTALACIYRAKEKRLIVGWVGDSQALLACEGKVCQIVSPHSPSIESERIRIEEMGGVIMNWDGSYRVNGQLAISRAIGDASHKPFISSEPDISSVSLDGGEDFLIIASDGLWESLSEDAIAILVYREIAKNPGCASSIADKIIESARKLTSDNITVIVVFFKDPYLIAKSTWLNKMETAYDNNTDTNVCEIETSHFKTYDTNHEFTTPEVAKDTFLEDDHKATNPVELLKSNINPDFKPDQTTSELLETKHRFDDDFGPETDVDAVDDANVAKTPNMLLEDNNFAADFSNGVKPFSLENKIIEHLSGQHKEFLTNTNPFNEDHFDPYNNQCTVKDELMDETAVEKSEIDSELVVDNKIIDALESLGITNGEKQAHADEDKPLDSGLVNESSAEVAGYTEKADNSHEKYYTELQNEDPFDHNASILDDKQTMEEQSYGINPNCAATSAGEESDEEDEWNYIQGDKKQDQPTEENEVVAASVEEPAVEAASLHQEPVDSVESIEEETHVPTEPTPSDAFVAVDEPSTLIDEHKETETELYESGQVLLEPVPAVSSPVIPTEEEYEHQEQEHPEQPVQETEQQESCDYTPSPVPRSEIQSEIPEEPISQPELESQPNLVPQPDLVSLEQEQPQDKDVEEQSENHQEEPEPKSEESDLVAGEESERPDSLSLDMASKLNPEAKEFVPTGSPTLSNPASPVASMPEMPQNSFLLLGDDVVAQSPKKGIATMDNIDVPAEDDFQLEMNKCPHELEQFPEHTNGTTNGDETIRSHSPVSEPSYQELNLKEAMQCDEKLDNEYNDVLQNDDTIDHHPTELNLLAKEQNPMNMSFYEGRDEALIVSNSDELNKVQPLPSDDESSEQNHVPSVDEALTPNEEEHSVEETAAVQNEDHLVSFENPVESVNESQHVEQLPESIFTAASQVVDDVTALVGQMQIEIPAVNNVIQQEDNANPIEVDEENLSKPNETEVVENTNVTENLVSFEQDAPFESHEPEQAIVDEIVSDLDVQPLQAELSQPLSAAETEEMASPVVEVSQQEITTDNEFITDENVLDVAPSPIPVTHEAPISPVPVAQNEPVEEELCVMEKEAAVEQMPEVVPLETPAEPASVEPATSVVNEQIIEEVKPVVMEETPVEKPTPSEELKVPKSKTPDQAASTVAKTAKTSTTGVAAKKAPIAAKTSAKPAAKPTTATKTSTAPPAVKKTAPAPSAAARTSTVGAKSPKVATTRTSTVGTADKKPAPSTTEKKLVNGEAKTTLAQKKTITSTTATAKSTSTAARPSSATTKPVTAKPLAAARTTASAPKTATSAKPPTATAAKAPVSATPRPTTGPAKTGSATTRTSTGLPATKPRVAPTTASKPAGAASTTTVASKTVSATKRISSVQTTTQKTATSTTTTTAAAKSSSTTSRTSVVSKTSTTSATGLLRKTGTTAPAKKPITSPATKTGSKTASAGKPAPIKSNAVTSLKDANTVNNETQDLLDLDKQLKNDNNQLITKNGIETQMIVIDSAAD